MQAEAIAQFTLRQAEFLPSVVLLHLWLGWLAADHRQLLAIGLCVIAIALIGMLMLSGRLPVRSGMRVVLGCFVLLGAPVNAEALMGFAGQGSVVPATSTPDETSQHCVLLPKSTYDPYAGASLRQA
ncbi:MAG: hypothetical protein ABGW87_07735 [Sphingomonadaceae bacterium]